MGLSIHYRLSLARNLASGVVRELAERTAHYARKIGCAEVDAVRPAFPNRGADLFVSVGKPEDGCFGLIPPTDGWLVEVWPGEGCESATFGLCQYPHRTPFRTGSVPTGYTRGWLLKSSCKTQYAGEHGWDHFLRCHKQVISLLDFWRSLGVTLKVSDEGEYWQTRSVRKLAERLRQNDRLVALAAGALKDASDDSAGPWRIQSPIFDYADFERLEHEGPLEFGTVVEGLPQLRTRGRV